MEKAYDPIWEQRFPGKGQELMDFLLPFYDWEPELKPTLPGLDERAETAIFWRILAGVRVRRSDLKTPGVDIKCPIGHSLMTSSKVLLGPVCWGPRGDVLRASMSVSVEVLLEPVWPLLMPLLFYPCCFILDDKPEEAAKFKSVLDLWLAGNFPVGFDAEGNLLVLVA
ncbi:hypothetical protein EDM68_01890 [Candidatus Uhrbacteria bacterium]|nr:MAG: hypothetical protein EDM68_01890 [Candidatus Uhrbacteria bacterium]